MMTSESPASRHLLRARDLADARYADPLSVADLAREARLSPAHFSRAFRHAFGEPPHRYLITRRLERAAALLCTTDWSVGRIATSVGWESIASFTTTFSRVYGQSPTRYRAVRPAASRLARIPACVVRVHARPRNRTFREASATARD
jgi:AraC-like DNA-binding protein